MRALAFAFALIAIGQPTESDRQDARFRTGVELVDLTVTVTDRDDRFVRNLRTDDFTVYEDDKPQRITHFSAERSPLSLGILLDASGSMNPEKLEAAKDAITRLVFNLLGQDDELFFIEFGYSAMLTQEWTTDRRQIAHALQNVERPTGDTAIYDAIALALPTAQSGRHGKKALLVISDGNDTRSVVTLTELRHMIMDTDVIVYALGIDAGSGLRQKGDDRLDVDKLRQITDDTGGRTEIVRRPQALNAAVVQLADELRHQYSIGYPSSLQKDGKWHTIRVEVRDRRAKVRARRGFTSD